MSERKRYTAQKMREMEAIVASGDIGTMTRETVADMLRQAADAEEENAQLKARLEAVVKECEKMRDDFSKRMYSFTGMGASNMESIYEDKIEVVDAILRVARGESENENK